MFLFFILLFTTVFGSTWSVDTTYSYINYHGKHLLHSWTGVSKDIGFTLDCNDSDCTVEASTNLDKFDSGNDSRDSNMLYYTESLEYPSVSFKTNSFKFNMDLDRSVDTKGILSFHGIEKEIPVKLMFSKKDDEFWGTCNFNVSLSDFDIDRPSLLMIKISDEIDIETKIKLVRY